MWLFVLKVSKLHELTRIKRISEEKHSSDSWINIMSEIRRFSS